MSQHIPGTVPVEVSLTVDPHGRHALLLQLPAGYVLFHRPADVRRVAAVLIEGSDRLEQAQKGAP